MVIILVGASGGLGGYVGDALARKGHDVIGTYCTRAPAVLGIDDVHLDITDNASVLSLVAELSCKRIVLVNMSGITCAAYTHKMSDGDWSRVMDVNLNGTFNLCKHFLPIMRQDGWGRIINISSVVAALGVPGTSAYAASKEGIVGLTRVIAKENADRGVTANVLSLGYFDRVMIQDVPEKMLETIRGQIPMGRFGDPANIVAAIEFLIEADYVTGAVIPINGGLV